MTMKVIVAGPRALDIYEVVERAIKTCDYNIKELVSGGAIGADQWGEHWANINKVPIKLFRPQYKVYHPKAAPLYRNQVMGVYADAAVIVWDGKSRGTAHMISVMEDLRKPHYIALYTNPWIDCVDSWKSYDEPEKKLNQLDV
jgi:hypothetical protein